MTINASTGRFSSLPDLIERSVHDPAVVAVTGSYALEVPQGTSIVNYKDIDSDDPATRVTGYLSYPRSKHAVLFGAAPRSRRACSSLHEGDAGLSVVSRSDFVPALFAERKVRANSSGFFISTISVCGERRDSSQKRDIDFYTAAGLDPAANKLQWLLCGFEGAALIMHSTDFPDYPPSQRQAIADRWFAVMFARFKRECADDQ